MSLDLATGTQQSLGFVPSLQESFEEFHAAHPEYYAEFVRLARVAMGRGYTRWSIKAICEIARWESPLPRRDLGEDDPPFKLPNAYTSRYARLIMAREPDLATFFVTQRLRAE